MGQQSSAAIELPFDQGGPGTAGPPQGPPAPLGRERRVRGALEPGCNKRGPREALCPPSPRPGCQGPLQAAPTGLPASRPPHAAPSPLPPCFPAVPLPNGRGATRPPSTPRAAAISGAPRLTPPQPAAPHRSAPLRSAPPHAPTCRAVREGRHRQREGVRAGGRRDQPSPGRPAGAADPTPRGGASSGGASLRRPGPRSLPGPAVGTARTRQLWFFSFPAEQNAPKSGGFEVWRLGRACGGALGVAGAVQA